MFWYESLLFQCAMTGQRPESMLLVGVGYLGLFGLRLMRGPWSVRECLLRQRTKRRSVWRGAAGDLGAGSFPLDKKEVPGIGCSREVPTEVLETGV